MRIIPIFAAIAFATCAPLAANTPPQPAPPNAQDGKKVCRNLPPRTGTHRPQGRICKTAAEWQARDKDVYAEGRFEHHNDFSPSKRNAGLPE